MHAWDRKVVSLLLSSSMKFMSFLSVESVGNINIGTLKFLFCYFFTSTQRFVSCCCVKHE